VNITRKVEKRKINNWAERSVCVTRTEMTGRMAADGHRKMTNRNWMIYIYIC
jgi:hypothetical protein